MLHQTELFLTLARNKSTEGKCYSNCVYFWRNSRLASQSQIWVNFQTTLPQWISRKVNVLSIKSRMWTDFHFSYAAESLVYFYINNKNRKDCEFRDGVAQMSKHFISVIKGSNLLCMFKTHSCTQSNYHLTDTQKPRIHFINVPL